MCSGVGASALDQSTCGHSVLREGENQGHSRWLDAPCSNPLCTKTWGCCGKEGSDRRCPSRCLVTAGWVWSHSVVGLTPSLHGANYLRHLPPVFPSWHLCCGCTESCSLDLSPPAQNTRPPGAAPAWLRLCSGHAGQVCTRATPGPDWRGVCHCSGMGKSRCQHRRATPRPGGDSPAQPEARRVSWEEGENRILSLPARISRAEPRGTWKAAPAREEEEPPSTHPRPGPGESQPGRSRCRSWHLLPL